LKAAGLFLVHEDESKRLELAFRETAPVAAVNNPSMTMFAIIFLPSSSAMRVAGIEKESPVAVSGDLTMS